LGVGVRDPAGVDWIKNFHNQTKDVQDRINTEHPDLRNETQAIHASLGALGVVDDKVGKPGEEITAIVLEFRRMRDSKKVEDLKPLALATYKLIGQLNSGELDSFRTSPEPAREDVPEAGSSSLHDPEHSAEDM
jgi:hypothetical protein